jgi:hypothetical protein
MWIAKKGNWHESHTDLSKYFIERLKQRVDYEETISNRHRTTNGFTLINEISEVALLTQKRIKSVHRLISLITESASKVINSSIVNDYILQKYHTDIIDFYSKINPNKLKDNGKELSELLNKSRINVLRLQGDYYSNLIYELEKIDFSSGEFERNSIIIDKLIECLIPYLLHQGYSVTSISDVAYRYIKKPNATNSPLQIIKNFSNERRDYCFLLKVEKDREEINSILNYLNSKSVEFEITTKEDISDFIFDDFNIEENEILYLIKHSTIDPHNYLRNIYEIGLKNHVAIKDRISLQFFTNFFDSVYWRFDLKKHKFQKSNISIDPINVPKRNSTLLTTLETLKRSYDFQFDEKEGIPFVLDIRDSLYYYNLALGSKSIENSLSLLWTSLETLLPYRLKNNDIENVQYFVSKSLSIGAIGREITSFASRFNNTNWVNNESLANLGLYTSYINYKPEGIRKWIDWLATEYSADNDPYETLKENSNLLCKNFCTLNDVFTGKNDNSVEYWLKKIKNSETSIKYQLDRIYLHRNQIVHSGKFINEYSNLWNHLEWYVGKLLSFTIIKFIQLEDKNDFDKEQIFMQLEADIDLLINLLENNKSKKISEIDFAYTLVARESWQFF